jgi:dipeptidyl aminopeptidase/acylaminoacyl peptidase
MTFGEAIAQEREKRAKRNVETQTEVSLDENINTPPKIYVTDKKTQQKVLLLDLNPQFADLQFGKVETIEWESSGVAFVGGLYLPPDFQTGKRYPLVIQTHGFSEDRFSMDGLDEWSSGYAARPLAASGFVVLQSYSIKDPRVWDGINNGKDKRFGLTPEQAERRLARAAFEGAIDYLDGQGVVDRSRVGISGFSRTVSYAAYTLTHTKYKFGAAVLTDGIDGGYFTEIVNPGDASEVGDAMNGGVTPFGEGIKEWLEESPSFNLDKVQAAVRLVGLDPPSVLNLWEWFSGLTLQGKPVELIEIPDGTHLLEKPWERRTAMQGMVDWFRFWLKGEEDPDPAKSGQYSRWRELRQLQESDKKGS